tara:strand:- start:913 stop:1134 length:222 start_codon:yes stop_codon:yes gene_type:complete
MKLGRRSTEIVHSRVGLLIDFHHPSSSCPDGHEDQNGDGMECFVEVGTTKTPAGRLSVTPQYNPFAIALNFPP